MIEIFGYNLGVALDAPMTDQNYTFSLTTEAELFEKLNSGNFVAGQVFYVKVKPAKSFTDLALKLLTNEDYNQIEVMIRCQFDSPKARDEGFRKLNRKFKSKYAAGGLVINEFQEFLAIKSRDRWSLPKGGIEPDESPEEAAIREVEEETGLLLPIVIGALNPSYHVFQDRKSKFILKKTHWFLMHVADRPEVVPQDEEGITEVKWFHTREWIAEKPLAYPQTSHYLQNYFSQPILGE